MKLQLSTIIQATGARIIPSEADTNTIVIESLTIDSRSPLHAPASEVMFCALPGATDGHRYISEMYNRGVRVFLVANPPAHETIADIPGAIFLVTCDVIAAIDSIASYCRRLLDKCRVIGITGSIGKTTVKELLYMSMLPFNKVERSPRSWNSRIGVPLSMIGLSDECDTIILEAGIDSHGTMSVLERIIKPHIGILTPITDEHDAGFASREEKIAEKVLLFKDSEIIFHPDEPGIAEAIAAINPTARLIPINVSTFNSDIVSAVTRETGIKADTCRAIEDISNRIDVHEGVNDCVMLYDAFTADVDSLPHALDFMNRRATNTRSNTLILTDLLHSPTADTTAVYHAAAAAARAAAVSRVVAIGPEITKHAGAFTDMKIDVIPSADDFFKSYDINDFSSETILIFGHPKETLGLIRDLLESPRHDTTLEVNLDSVVHNFNYYRSLLKKDTGLIAMVKASAYGTGAVEISKTLQAQGASYLAVAVIDEGVELRRGGITMPIMVLNPVTGNYKALFDYGLEPSVFSMRELDTLCEAARRAGVNSFKAHIKLDTGMHRVGFTADEIGELGQRLASDRSITVASIFSHLATADCLDRDDYTAMQLEAFESMSSSLLAAIPYQTKRHILNTAGMMRYPMHQYDMVRLGIGLYGISPIPGNVPLRPVASLKSTVITMRKWPTGTTVSYGCRGLLHRDSVIATVPIGYADGLDRHLSCGSASMMVRGVKCPVVGTICMDQCMIDVTDVADVAIGDEVEIFGEHMPVEHLAEILGTIPYEIISTVAPRVKRIYYRD
ncbi:MAG: alanine racemase [Odoribacter sp.]|nr:alanine racemase [Odoribacter sp.]